MGAENINVPENSKTETTESRELSGATLEQVNEELLTINRIITAIAGVSDLDEILRKVLDEALAITGIEGGTICMVTPQDTLELTACRATSEATITDLTTNEIKIGDCLCGAAARDHKPLILRDREEVLKFSSREAARGEDIRFHAAFPLITGNRCLGVLCVFTRTDKKPLERRLHLLETVTAQIAMAMENAQLYKETMQHAAMLEDKVRELDQIKNYNRVLFEESAIGLALCRMDGQLVDVNPAFAAIIGRTIGETLKLTYWDITPEKYAAQEAQRLEFLRTTGRYGPYEKEHIRKDGSLVPVMLQGRIIESDGEKFILSGVEDITERKKAEDMLLKNEEIFRLFVEYSPAAIAMFDLNMNYIVASRRYLEDYGLGNQVLTGRHHYEVFPEMQERWKEIHRRCLAGAIERCDEDPFMRADGRLDWVKWEIHPWHEAQGEIGGIILFSEVITERKKVDQELKEHREHLEELVRERTAELKDSQTALMNMVEDLNQKTEELRIANERLKELDRLKSMFIASMSHELRTPLNSIIGFTGIILQGMAGEINEEQRDQLQRVSRAGKHLLALITDVIDISKIEAGKIEVYAEEFQIESVLNEAVSNLKLQIREKGLEVEVSTAPEKIILKTDRKRLLQCVLNLLSNAVKFTEKGKIAIVAEDKGDIMQLSVTDTGIGIKEEDLPMLFNSFVRLDSPLKMSVSGTGLGLYLTKKLSAEVLGGEVVATSNYGKGSTFMLSIPKNLRGNRDEVHI